MAAKKGESVVLEAGGREVRLSNPGKVFFPEPGLTKLDLANYYLACEEAVVRGLRDRPTVLKRWVDGVQGSRSSRSGCPTVPPSGCRPQP